jgi:hypothetical protein
LLDELIEVADGRDHQRALSVRRHRKVMGQAVALARGPVAVQGDGALPVEMHGRDVLVKVVEHRGQRLPAVQFLGRFLGRQVVEHQEAGVLGEQVQLAPGVAPVGAVRVGVNQLPDSQPVGRFLRRDSRMGRHGHPFLVTLAERGGVDSEFGDDDPADFRVGQQLIAGLDLIEADFG